MKTIDANNTMMQPPKQPVKFKFKAKSKADSGGSKFKFKIKPKSNTNMVSNETHPNHPRDPAVDSHQSLVKYDKHSQYITFVNFCLQHKLPYFQFYDVGNWKGPVTKIEHNQLDTMLPLFDQAQSYLRTIVLNGYGFAIVKPIEHLDDSNITYTLSYYDACKFTNEPIIPYNSDDDEHNDTNEHYDSDAIYSADTDEEHDFIEVEEEFIAEEWTYNGTTYLLDTSTNYLYFPSTLEFIGIKTSEFSIDFNAKER